MIDVQLQDLLVLGICAIAHLAYRHRRKKLLPLPPGIPGWPLLGNALDMPLQYVHVFYKDLGKRLGTKIIHMEALGMHVIVLNDIEMAQDLLEKRSALYSSRSVSGFTVLDVHGLLHLTERSAKVSSLFSTMPYGVNWRHHRRMFEQYFSDNSLPRVQEMQIEFLRKCLLVNLYSHPDQFEEHVKNCVGGVSTSMTYGFTVQRQDDPVVHYFEKAIVDATAAAAPGNFLVNIIPQLKYIPEWMPGAHFKKTGRELRKRLLEAMDVPYQKSLDSMNAGTARESFVSATLERHRDQSDFEGKAVCAKETAGDVFGAASETTVASTMTFILAMLKYPDVQRMGQQELDSVVGPDRLPDFSDLSCLPYLSAIVKEVLRWNPIAPAGVPHLTTDEDTYNGYYIPKNCMIIANTYAMLHDEEIFQNPTNFDPSRFTNIDGTIRNDLPNPEKIATFGFGRRICPGRDIALSMLHIVAASILHLFDIAPAYDNEGNPVDVEPKFYAESLVSNPLPFKCKITPRAGRDVESLLQEYVGTDPI
ncbi:O-methylsterigmatocystin oxidoreductase [Leucoagaricus sp. SymC.cos]|nr:O-methylsterigmatocystin oxidoreductase [Leucoagaricus sp. SymC.cos]